MANLKLKNPAGGSLNFASADGASDLTVTFPATTGTAMVSGNMPAFGVYGSTGTSLINNTDTKIVYDTEEFDTNNNFASSRFTPTVAGYYQLNACILLNVSSGILGIMLFKNGSRFKYGSQKLNTTSYVGAPLSTLVYANGSTDYFEIFGITSGGTATNEGGQIFNYFNGSLVRAA